MILPRIRNRRGAGARVAGLAFLLTTCLGAAPARAQHVFDYAFDRFEIDGNQYGALDGAPDLVENFDALGSFYPFFGTVQVTGGALHLSNPGTALIIFGPTGTEVLLDQSLVLSSTLFTDGAGDFTASAVLKRKAIGLNDAITFGATAINHEVVALVLSNLDAARAAATGIQSGYAMSLLFLTSPLNTRATVIESSSASINPNSITGDIVFKMSVDDASNMLTASFSLNGGATFQSPLPPMAIFREGSAYNFLLYADPEDLAGATTTSTIMTTTTTTTSTSIPAVCGDGVRSPSEQCDDGNTASGDGCSDTCTIEPGWSCAGQPSVCQPGGNQTILGKQLLVKDASLGLDPTKRKLVGQGVEPASPNTIVGDPRIAGATITFSADGATPSSQTFDLPRAYWALLGTTAFKYTAAKDASGRPVTAVSQAQIKKLGSGTFKITATVVGKAVSELIAMVPPNPGTGGCVVFTINGGDRYHMRFGAGATVKQNDAVAFSIKNATSEGLCP